MTIKLGVETESIGEYVVLYQQQRAVMQSRVAAKDDYIRRCTQEIAALTQRVSDLQAVVATLHTAPREGPVSHPAAVATTAPHSPDRHAADAPSPSRLLGPHAAASSPAAADAEDGARLAQLMAPVGAKEEWWLKSCWCCRGPVLHL